MQFYSVSFITATEILLKFSVLHGLKMVTLWRLNSSEPAPAFTLRACYKLLLSPLALFLLYYLYFVLLLTKPSLALNKKNPSEHAK